jgi:beta-lactamase regulating signal transducer with metallopeptidase domain
MIAAWMLYCTAVALLLGTAAAAVEHTARLLGRPGRWVWAGALVVTFGLPLAARYRPNAFATIDVPLSVTPVETSTQASRTVMESPRLGTPAWGFSWGDLDRPLALLWAGLSLGLLGFGAVAALRLRRLRRRWHSATVDGTPALVSANLGPAVVGVIRCRLVVPAWTLELDPRLRELMLAHECEHVRGGDPRLLVSASVLLALMPWNIGLWWQWRRLRLAVEMDCDARVLRRHPDRARYGDLLLEVSQRASHSVLPVAAFHEPMSLLERRLRAITSGRPHRLALQAVVLVTAAALLVVGACETPRPTAPRERPAPFSINIRNEDGQISSRFIRDSVDRYFPEIAAHWSNQAVYLWFVIGPDGSVIRHGTSPRDLRDTSRLSTTMIPTIVPGFEFPKAQMVTLVGSDAMGAGSPPIVWAQLRDPSKPATYLPPTVDELALLPWIRDGITRYYPEVLREQRGPSTHLLFVSNLEHKVVYTKQVPYRRISGLQVIMDELPGLTAPMVRSFSVTGTHGLTRNTVEVIWVQLNPTAEAEVWLRGTKGNPVARPP